MKSLMKDCFLVTVRNVRQVNPQSCDFLLWENKYLCIPKKRKSVLQHPDPPPRAHSATLPSCVLVFFLLMLLVTLSECYSHNDSWYGQKRALRWNLEKGTSSTPMPWLRRHAQPSYLATRCSRQLTALQHAAQHQNTLKTLNLCC